MNNENDRPDIQLSRDRAQGMMRDNFYNGQIDQELAMSDFQVWGIPDDDSTGWSNIIEELVSNGGGRWLGSKSSIYQDYSISDIIEQIVILASIVPDSWDTPITGTEQIQVDVQIRPDQVEIQVRLLE
jgi:hypothetical protein